MILSLQFNSKEKEYLFAKAYDLANHLVAFIPEDNNIFVRIENFMTGQYMNIIESDLYPATIKGDCIDDIYFSKDSIIIKWQGKEWSNNKADPKEIKLKIELR